MKYFIFDIDGTLLDTEKMYMLPLVEVLNDNGYQVTYEQAKTTFGITSLDALKMLNVKSTDVEKIIEKWEALIPNYTKEVKLFDGVLKTLAALHNDGSKLAIASSKVKEEYIRDVARFDIDQYLLDIVLADQVQRGKPYPDMINKAKIDLQASDNETIYIGDTIYDMQAAHNANVAFGLAGWETKFSDKFKDAEYVFFKPEDILTV